MDAACSQQIASKQTPQHLKDHQKFSQWLKYQQKNVKSKKHSEVLQLAELYQKLQTPDQRRSFISKWLKNGGAKGDIAILVKQDIHISNENSAVDVVGYMTPGMIAEKEHVARARYESEQQFMDAIKFLIEQSQQSHPPPEGEPCSLEGVDFWTTKFFYAVGGIEEQKKQTATTQSFSRNAELAASGSSSQALAGAATALSVVDVDMVPDAADGAEKDEDKALSRERAMLAKKAKVVQRAYASMVSLLAKCRSHVLLQDPARSTPLNKLEKECTMMMPKSDGDNTTEELEGKLQGINHLVARLHYTFPECAPKAKRARVGSFDGKAVEVIPVSDGSAAPEGVTGDSAAADPPPAAEEELPAGGAEPAAAEDGDAE